MGPATSRRLRWPTRLLPTVLLALGSSGCAAGCDGHSDERQPQGAASRGDGSRDPSARRAAPPPPTDAFRADRGASAQPFQGASDGSEIERLLLPLRSYRDRVRSAPGTVTMHVECPDRSLTYVGFQHSNDPTSPRFARLETEWGKFVRRSRGRHRRVLVEGRVRPEAPNRDSAIADCGGEGGLVTFLARREGVDELASPEPSAERVAQSLGDRFEPGAICVAYFARAVALWNAQGGPVPLEPFIESLPMPRQSGCRFSLESMAAPFQQWVGVALDPNDAELFRWLTDPAHDDTVVARILRADTAQRDVHVVRELERRFSGGQALFAVYGTAHVLVQEPALRELLCRRCSPAACQVEVTHHGNDADSVPAGRGEDPSAAAQGATGAGEVPQAAGYSGGSRSSSTRSP